MSETILQRAPGFFRTPQRCRQKYDEAWSIGKAVYDELLRVRALPNDRDLVDLLERRLSALREKHRKRPRYEMVAILVAPHEASVRSAGNRAVLQEDDD